MDAAARRGAARWTLGGGLPRLLQGFGHAVEVGDHGASAALSSLPVALPRREPPASRSRPPGRANGSRRGTEASPGGDGSARDAIGLARQVEDPGGFRSAQGNDRDEDSPSVFVDGLGGSVSHYDVLPEQNPSIDSRRGRAHGLRSRGHPGQESSLTPACPAGSSARWPPDPLSSELLIAAAAHLVLQAPNRRPRALADARPIPVSLRHRVGECSGPAATTRCPWGRDDRPRGRPRGGGLSPSQRTCPRGPGG